MRVLIFSDHHGHAWKPYSEVLPDGMNNRLKDGNRVLAQISELAKSENVDLILGAGDLYHARGNIHVQTFNTVYDEIAKMRMVCPVALLVGNHDQTNKAGNVHSVYSMRSVVEVMDSPGWYPLEGRDGSVIHVLAVPYHPDKEVLRATIEKLAGEVPSKLEPTILLGHFGIDGAKVGGNFVLVDKHSLKASELPSGTLDYMFLGHYHEPQQLLPNCYYIGATHQHNWGDSDQDRGCLIWDTTENDEYSEPTFFRLDAPRFVKLPFSEKIDENKVVNNYVRVLSDEPIMKSISDQYSAHLKALGARSVEFFFDDPNGKHHISTTVFHDGMDMEKMLERYVDEVSVNRMVDAEDLTDSGLDILRAIQA